MTDNILAIITIISFIIAIWQILHSHELKNALKDIYEISRDYKNNNSHYGEALQSIKKISATRLHIKEDCNIDLLVKNDVILYKNDISAIENNSKVSDVWLVTPDLEPDLSDRDIGKVVSKNLKRNVRYIYFFKESLDCAEEKQECLIKNVCTDDSEKQNVQFVGLPDQQYSDFFYRHNNLIFIFQEDDRYRCFEELFLTKIKERGTYWQEHDIHYSARWKQRLSKSIEEKLG